MRTIATLSTISAFALALLSGCSAGEEPGAGDESQAALDVETLTRHNYDLDSVSADSEARELMAGAAATLSFPQGGLSVSTDCNGFAAGSVSLEDGVIAMQNVAATEMGCEELLMEQDRWLLEFFQSEPEWELEGGTLTLIGADAVATLRQTD